MTHPPGPMYSMTLKVWRHLSLVLLISTSLPRRQKHSPLQWRDTHENALDQGQAGPGALRSGCLPRGRGRARAGRQSALQRGAERNLFQQPGVHAGARPGRGQAGPGAHGAGPRHLRNRSRQDHRCHQPHPGADRQQREGLDGIPEPAVLHARRGEGGRRGQEAARPHHQGQHGRRRRGAQAWRQGRGTPAGGGADSL